MPDRTWFLIPAAGASARYGGRTPKPYVRLAGRCVLEHALGALLATPGLAGGVVVTRAGDRRWGRLPAALRRRVLRTDGGAQRADSVLSGLRALIGAGAAPRDWVLVHDAARPCLPAGDLRALRAACRHERVGGLLALPVSETLKRAGRGGRSLGSLPREGVHRAQTPQMFRLGLLVRALERARKRGAAPTDEAAAVEALGLRPRLVEGSPLNVKITRPADLAFAAAALASLEKQR